MTVQELINHLNEVQDKTRIVILQRDSEGNGYSPLSYADDNCTYAATTKHSGEVGVERLTGQLRKIGFTEEDQNDGVPCLVLAPVN